MLSLRTRRTKPSAGIKQTILRGDLQGDSVNYEHLDPDAALRPDRVPDERVLAERQQHQLCASVIPSSAPVIWTLLASPVCGRSCDDPCRVPCRGVT